MSGTQRTLDEALHSLTFEEKAYLKEQIGIDDDDELKAHILAVQEKAYKSHPYPCFRLFTFVRPMLSRLPAYPHVIKLGKERKGALLLEIGCGFGNEPRKLVADGYPIENIIASDLHPDLWESGHELFRSTPETFPVAFVAGDALDPSHLSSDLAPFHEPPTTPIPVLSDLTSLNPLQGHVSAIYAGLFFHLFSEEQQSQIARALASLLSPLPGSIILGGHLGLAKAGIHEIEGQNLFCHSPESWRELWDGAVFKKRTVTVNAGLIKLPRNNQADATSDNAVHYMYWSVMRE